ncbi:hypothetical protein AB0910_25865 [Streptomyces sp. NPDC047002]|uniref:hypothetical protein n=1 Tax=Streptomyces sp. NPDC047002 TaxID=3155475 RepID=UPI003456DBC4
MTSHGVRRMRQDGAVGIEPGACLAELRGDCARMAARWAARPLGSVTPDAPARAARVRVDPASVLLVARMAEYGA